MQGPPPPWFFLALFPVAAVSAAIVFASIGATISRLRRGRVAAQLPAPVPNEQVARLQAEVDELRTQVERLTAAESFYAQLQGPGASSSEPHG
ncbi:MAG: bZIP transcription factor [Longimicrobiaceae bacterium]